MAAGIWPVKIQGVIVSTGWQLMYMPWTTSRTEKTRVSDTHSNSLVEEGNEFMTEQSKWKITGGHLVGCCNGSSTGSILIHFIR
jgi:hypothetical protein